MHMQIDLDNLKCLSPGLHCLLQLFLGPPSQGPDVHVPPPKPSPPYSIYCRKHQKSQPILVAWQTCDGLADWNQRKVTQYGGQQNHIQDLALVDDCRLTLIHPG